MNRNSALSLLFGVWSVGAGTPAPALELDFPVNARLTAERASEVDSFEAPIGVFDGVGVASMVIEGRIERRAWRISSPGLTPLQVMVPFRNQLTGLGYDVIFECDSLHCGGFDFRFSTEVMPGPNMYVDITNYRYLTAVQGEEASQRRVVGVLTSSTAEAAYVQIITAEQTTQEHDAAEIVPEAEQPVSTEVRPLPVHEAGLETQLATSGRVILADLEFATGTSELGSGPFPSLAELAALLDRQSDWRIALVGHTDAVGGLATNIDLSKARALSVRARLLDDYGADETRITAEGIGFLAPVAPNLTEAQRAANRRVEAVLLNSE